MSRYRFVLALAALTLPAAAQAMDVHTFLTKAEALQKKGMFALMSPDLKLLKGEMEGISRQWNVDKTAAAAAGRPLNCAPKGAKLSQNAFLAELRAIPMAERGMSMKQAFYRIAIKRFPCPA